MNNNNFKEILNELNIDNNGRKVKKERFTTTLNKEMLDDYRELCKALKIQLNEGVEIMFYLLYYNESCLKDFLKEARRV